MPRKSLNRTGGKRSKNSELNSYATSGDGESLSTSWEDRDYRDILREIAKSPAVRYVAGGITMALLTRLANNMADKYPEISTFIRENVENLEGRFGNFNSAFGNSSEKH